MHNRYSRQGTASLFRQLYCWSYPKITNFKLLQSLLESGNNLKIYFIDGSNFVRIKFILFILLHQSAFARGDMVVFELPIVQQFMFQLGIPNFQRNKSFIEIAIVGNDYCDTCEDTKDLLLAYPITGPKIDAISSIMSLVGRFCIALITTFIFYLIITFDSTTKEIVQEPIYLLVLIFISAQTISQIFMSVIEVSMDTILECYLIDERCNKRAVNAPQKLGNVMAKLGISSD